MKLWSLSVMWLCLAAGWTQAEPVPAAATVTSVIVYRGQALVTRTLEIPQTVGEMELLVENLPEKILPESLYAQSDGSISVLSVRYRENVVTEDKREQVVELKERIEQIRRELYLIRRDRELLAWRWARYEEQWKVNLDATNRDLNTKGLDVEAFKNLTGHLDQQADAILKEQVRQETASMDLEKQLAELEKELDELSQARRKVNRQALVYIARGDRAKGQISLSYLVSDANWQPQYNLRAVPDREKAAVEYNAVVFQSSGEDWINAALALSTAEPMMVSAPPGLVPMKVTLGAGGRERQVQQSAMPASMAGMMGGDFRDQGAVFDSLASSRRDNIAKGVKAERELNTISISNQMIELEADRRMLMALKERAVAVRQTEGVSVMYSLKGRLSLPSRTEQQILNIASFECPARFVFVASPLLTDYVYLQADIVNTGQTIFLPGPASMFRNGEFVGRSEMKLVTSGQTFVAGFGIDSQIQVVREFADTKTEVLLGSRTGQQHYRIALSNYKNTPVSVRLLDRIPWTENASLAIELKETSHPLSSDGEYLRTQKPKGILRWDLQLAPGTGGAEATVLTYVYAMKYDKSLSVVSNGQ